MRFTNDDIFDLRPRSANKASVLVAGLLRLCDIDIDITTNLHMTFATKVNGKEFMEEVRKIQLEWGVKPFARLNSHAYSYDDVSRFQEYVSGMHGNREFVLEFEHNGRNVKVTTHHNEKIRTGEGLSRDFTYIIKVEVSLCLEALFEDEPVPAKQENETKEVINGCYTFMSTAPVSLLGRCFIRDAIRCRISNVGAIGQYDQRVSIGKLYEPIRQESAKASKNVARSFSADFKNVLGEEFEKTVLVDGKPTKIKAYNFDDLWLTKEGDEFYVFFMLRQK